MRLISLLLGATFLAACGSATTTHAGGGVGPSEGPRPDGGAGSSETALPDLTTEPKSEVSFPDDITPFSYGAFALGVDGAVTIAASANSDIVVVGYAPDLTRRFVLATKEVLNAATVRAIVPRARGGAVVEYGEQDTALREGFIASFLADGSPAHAVIKVPRAAYTMAIDPEDRVVYGSEEGIDGDGASWRPVVRRLTPSGAADVTFGSGSKASFSCASGYTTAPTLLATDASGGIVALVSGDVGALFLAKLTPTGTLDTTFGVAGCAPLAGITKEKLALTSLAIDARGTIWLSGAVQGLAVDQGAVLKFLPTGSPDSSFGSGGLVKLIPDTISANRIRTVQPRGTGLLVLNERFVGNSLPRRDLFTIDAHGKLAAQPLIADTKYLDFKLTPNELNMYGLQSDRAGRIATP